VADTWRLVQCQSKRRCGTPLVCADFYSPRFRRALFAHLYHGRCNGARRGTHCVQPAAHTSEPLAPRTVARTEHCHACATACTPQARTSKSQSPHRRPAASARGACARDRDWPGDDSQAYSVASLCRVCQEGLRRLAAYLWRHSAHRVCDCAASMPRTQAGRESLCSGGREH
jgi:hypothetical protein